MHRDITYIQFKSYKIMQPTPQIGFYKDNQSHFW